MHTYMHFPKSNILSTTNTAVVPYNFHKNSLAEDLSSGYPRKKVYKWSESGLNWRQAVDHKFAARQHNHNSEEKDKLLDL